VYCIKYVILLLFSKVIISLIVELRLFVCILSYLILIYLIYPDAVALALIIISSCDFTEVQNIDISSLPLLLLSIINWTHCSWTGIWQIRLEIWLDFRKGPHSRPARAEVCYKSTHHVKTIYTPNCRTGNLFCWLWVGWELSVCHYLTDLRLRTKHSTGTEPAFILRNNVNVASCWNTA